MVCSQNHRLAYGTGATAGVCAQLPRRTPLILWLRTVKGWMKRAGTDTNAAAAAHATGQARKTGNPRAAGVMWSKGGIPGVPAAAAANRTTAADRPVTCAREGRRC